MSLAVLDSGLGRVLRSKGMLPYFGQLLAMDRQLSCSKSDMIQKDGVFTVVSKTLESPPVQSLNGLIIRLNMCICVIKNKEDS